MKKVKQIVKQNGSMTCSSEERVAVLVSKRGTPGATRTHDTRFRKPLLYPTELQGHTDRFRVIHHTRTLPLSHAQCTGDYSTFLPCQSLPLLLYYTSTPSVLHAFHEQPDTSPRGHLFEDKGGKIWPGSRRLTK